MSEVNSPLGIAVEEIPGLPILKEPRPDPCALVIFGAFGDLTRRKLVPALYNLTADGALPGPIGVVGFARRTISADDFRAHLRESTGQFSRRKPFDSQISKPTSGCFSTA